MNANEPGRQINAKALSGLSYQESDPTLTPPGRAHAPGTVEWCNRVRVKFSGRRRRDGVGESA